MTDEKARAILLKAFGLSDGGRPKKPAVGPDDIRYAKSKGYLFDPIALSHDQIVEELLAIRTQTDMHAVAMAFLSSLGNRRLEQRSALGSYAFASHFADHKLAQSPKHRLPSGGLHCDVCGIIEFTPPWEDDLSTLNFERHKWGGVRHSDPLYAWFDLRQFGKLEPDEPKDSDRDLLRQILRTASGMPAEARPNALEKALTGLFPSNKHERRTLIEILGLCGILQPRDQGGFFGEFTMSCDRDRPPEHTNDWEFPVSWWRGHDGVNPVAVDAYFPGL